MKNTLALLSLAAVLSGCQTLDPTVSDGQTPALESHQTAVKAAPKVYRSFTEQTLYALLVGELAGQRNRFDIALAQYSHQAQITQDAGVAERAFRIAEYVGDQQAATENALIWAKTDANNVDAIRALAIQLAKIGEFDASMAQMERLLNAQGAAHFDFLALAAAETDPQTRQGIAQGFDRLLLKHPNNAQLIFGKALLLHQDERTEEALQLLSAHDLRHDPAPLLLEVRLLQAVKRSEQALPLLRQAIKANPDDRRLHLTYARVLIELEQFDEARSEFAGLLQQNPADDDLRFSLALVCLESQAWDEAIVYLNELIERQAHVNPARYNLGRAYENKNMPARALEHYRQVGPSDEYLPANLRLLEILLKQNQVNAAQQHFANARAEQPDYAIQLYLLETESLAKADPDKAWTLVHQALDQYPEDTALRYTRGMLADSRNDIAQFEQDMRLIIEQEPDNANALNALGYTLADRTNRYEEAQQLIERAHTLDPQNPAILDSLGWVHYRLGELQLAQEYLQQAFERYPDAEIAAHLGEVLWQAGQSAQAKRVWRQALQLDAKNPTLIQTLKRLTGQETL